jgi:hypothetical protein
MKTRLVLFSMIGVLMLAVATAGAATTLKRLGRHPFYDPPLASMAELRNMVETRQADLSAGFARAGEPALFEAFRQQFPEARITPVKFGYGETMQWMLFKKGGKVRVLKDVTWRGKDPFDAYQFAIDMNGRRYVFVVPLRCGNLGLKEVAPAPTPEAAAPPPPPAPANKTPQCLLSVSPEHVSSGGQVTADAGASSDPDGSIASVKFSLIDPAGNTVDEKIVTTPPFVQQMTVPHSGTYRVVATVTDNAGATATSPECEKQVVASRRGQVIGDVGFFRQFDPQNYLALRIGYEYYLNESFSLIGMIGGFPTLTGNDGAGAFVIDALANYRFAQRFFAGIGVGGWITNGDQDLDAEDSQADLIVNVGVRVFGEPDAFNTAIFFEARSAFDEFDDIDKYGRFGVGLRFGF